MDAEHRCRLHTSFLTSGVYLKSNETIRTTWNHRYPIAFEYIESLPDLFRIKTNSYTSRTRLNNYPYEDVEQDISSSERQFPRARMGTMDSITPAIPTSIVLFSSVSTTLLIECTNLQEITYSFILTTPAFSRTRMYSSTAFRETGTYSALTALRTSVMLRFPSTKFNVSYGIFPADGIPEGISF